MGRQAKRFKIQSEKVAFDKKHRHTIGFNMERYEEAVENGMNQFEDIDHARDRVSEIKDKVINNLDKYLEQFEENFTKRGGKVIWARDGREAVRNIIEILEKNDAKLVVKSKSMTTEEIDLNKYVEAKGIENLETDLGEYIVQVAGERPYHIVTPAMHKSKEDVAKLFNEKFGTPVDSTPEFLTGYVRELLREKYTSADVGITGGNFLIADIGAVAVTENEGNALMSTSFPRVHIAVDGIEKIIPSVHDLHYIWPLLATRGTGQNISVYNTIFTGPRQEGEIDGPEEMYVILLDNGRSQLLADPELREALKCIRCGACLNECPVYRNIGGYTYDSVYSGPIGSIITPHLKGFKQYKHLSDACSLCRKCAEVCPVKINLPELHLINRRKATERGYNNISWNISMYGYKKVMLNRKILDISGGGMKNFAARTFGKGIWGPRRELPHISKRSFSKIWKSKK